MIWTLLGIEETKDKKAISRAYRERLASVNPEEKPEEFKELRAAYEKAMELAGQEEKPQEEKTGLELWTDDLGALYSDLEKRLDPEAWRELLSREICQALDTRPAAENALLSFFLEHFNIPKKIMQFLNEQFDFTGHMQELRETFPADFLEYVIEESLRSEENFPLELFSPGKDGRAADAYLAAYRRIYRTDPAEAAPLYEKLKNSTEKHPYGEALLWKLQLESDAQRAVEELRKLQEAWPEDDHLALDLMFAYKAAGRMDAVEELADRCLARNPQLKAARRFKAEAAAARGEYQRAIDLINPLLKESSGNQEEYRELIELRQNWGRADTGRLQEKLAADPDDAESRYELLWTLLYDEKTEEAAELAEKLPEGQPDAFSYYNVKSLLAMEAGRCEEALEHLKKLLEAVEALRPDGTEKTAERIGRHGEVRLRIAAALFSLGRQEEALEAGEQSVQEGNTDAETLMHLITMYLQARNFGRAGELAELLIGKDRRNAAAYYLKAFASFREGKDSAAFEAVSKSLERDASSLQSYLLKLRILVRNGALEAAQELIAYLEQNGIKDDPTVDYCRMDMFRRQKDENRTAEEYDAVLATAAETAEKLKSGEYGIPDWAGHFYLLYALTVADRQDFDKEYPVAPLIALLDQGLAMEPESIPCLDYKGWLLKKDGKWEEALEVFQKLEQIPEHGTSAEEGLAGLYYSRLNDHAEDALKYYKYLLEQEPENGELYFYAGMCLYRMERPAEAEYYFRKEQEYAPEDIDGYYRLAFVYLKLNRLEEALEQGNRTVELAKKRSGDTVRFWKPVINVYCRLGQTEKAAAAVTDCAESNPDWDCHRRVFDIYVQAGLYEEAEKYLRRWRGSIISGFPEGWATAQAELYMLQQNMGRLQFHLVNCQAGIAPAVFVHAKLLLAAYKGKQEKYLGIAEANYKGLLAAQKEVSVYQRLKYVRELYLGGNTGKAKAQAAELLETTERNIAQANGCRLLDQGRRIFLLAVLGREEETRAAITEAGTQYPCDDCEYRACKDLDIYRCEAEFIFGNYGKAMELAVRGAQMWPDEVDFVEMQYFIKAKGNY